jgi:hypothetical protein
MEVLKENNKHLIVASIASTIGIPPVAVEQAAMCMEDVMWPDGNDKSRLMRVNKGPQAKAKA